MRSLMLASTLMLLRVSAFAEQYCALPPGPWDAAPDPPGRVALPDPPVRAARPDPAPATQASATPVAPIVLPPALAHLVAEGSQLTDIGAAHGMRGVVAHSGKPFMVFHAVPDGSAVVGGLIAELTPSELLAAAGEQARELGVSHGLRGIFVDYGSGFQVYYVTPDWERVIAGGMWDATGHNVTADQVTGIPGTVATLEVGPNAQGIPIDAAVTAAAAVPAPSAVALVEKASAGAFGDPGAPKLYMFVDPMCSFSVRTMRQLKPLVDAKTLQVVVIPTAILDQEDGGRSTTSSLAMLSLPANQMVPAWAAGRLDTPPVPQARAMLAATRAASEQLQIRGTPTLIWRKAAGSEGRANGLPANLNALAATMMR